MYRSSNVFASGLLALFLSLILGISLSSTNDDLRENEQPPTTCSIPVVAPSFNLTTVRAHYKSKQQVDVEVALQLLHPGITGLDDQVEYNVTLRPVNNWYAAASTVATGQVTVKDRRVVSIHFVVPKQDATALNSWELEVYADAGPNTGSNSGLDRAYLSFLDQTKDEPTPILRTPAEFWHTKTEELKRSNHTLPRIEQDNIRECECENTTWISTQSFRPQPDEPLQPRRRIPISIKVVYEDPTGIKRGLANARVELLTDPFAPQSAWAYTLNSAGRANDIIVTTDDLLPFAAKLYLDDPLFSMRQGTTETNTVLWMYDLNFSFSRGGITVTGDLVAAIGPDIGHVWSEFHRIRSGGEAVIGLSGVPHVDVWFPCNGADCTPVCDPTTGSCTSPNSFYRPGSNRIALNTVHTRVAEVLSHEYGHHIMQSLMPGGIPRDARTGDHTLCSTNANDAMAWVEGYATAFGLKATGQRTFYGLDFEALSCAANRDMLTSEGRVAAGMLDLMDVGAAPECSSGNDDLGRPGYCDRTTGNLFNPYTVLRQSIAGASFTSVTKWWSALAASVRGQVGAVQGWEAMRYNYYPLPPCRRRWRGICLDIILRPQLPWRPFRWVPGPSQSRANSAPWVTSQSDLPVKTDL